MPLAKQSRKGFRMNLRKSTIPRCPFCGAKPNRVESDSLAAWVLCDCGAQGPSVPIEGDKNRAATEAIQKWSERPK